MKSNVFHKKVNPRDVKRELARKIVEICYSLDHAKRARNFDKIFIKKIFLKIFLRSN